LETSEGKPPAWFVECELRAYGVMGILQHLGGIIFGKPQDEMHFDAYQAAILKVLKEYNRTDLPVLYNLNFGHTEPKFCLPYGALAEIDCESVQFSLLESAVLPG
jgi:muramoyltetrapeptide carboxypeptidase LdcA involved in peptidoglycan recycling